MPSPHTPAPESAHTPGPWRACEPDSNFGKGKKFVRPVNGEKLIATVSGEPRFAEREANARLIAAAPDYHQATRAFLKHYEKLSDDLLKELAEDTHGSVFSVSGTVTLTRHIAESVLAFRAIQAKAQGGK